MPRQGGVPAGILQPAGGEKQTPNHDVQRMLHVTTGKKRSAAMRLDRFANGLSWTEGGHSHSIGLLESAVPKELGGLILGSPMSIGGRAPARLLIYAGAGPHAYQTPIHCW